MLGLFGLFSQGGSQVVKEKTVKSTECRIESAECRVMYVPDIG